MTAGPGADGGDDAALDERSPASDGENGAGDSEPTTPDERSDAPDDERTDRDGESDGWKFGLDEVDEDGVVDDRESIEPGSPTLENSLFVLLGALVTIGIIVRVAMVFAV